MSWSSWTQQNIIWDLGHRKILFLLLEYPYLLGSWNKSRWLLYYPHDMVWTWSNVEKKRETICLVAKHGTSEPNWLITSPHDVLEWSAKTESKDCSWYIPLVLSPSSKQSHRIFMTFASRFQLSSTIRSDAKISMKTRWWYRYNTSTIFPLKDLFKHPFSIYCRIHHSCRTIYAYYFF